jgi:transposase
MAAKSTKYHLEIQTHRKKPYGLLRNSYRVDGKVRHETLCRFTGLSLSQLRDMQAAIQGKIVSKDKFVITGSREYGASYAVAALFKQLGLHKTLLARSGEEWVRACTAMVVGRIVYAGSKLSLSHCGSFSALWEICGIKGDVDVDKHCYEAMDTLLGRQQAIQRALAKKHISDGTLVLYDITSSYMEGEYENSDLVNFGYNRDQKRGHEQIVISLLCAKDGCPVAVDVLKGNTKDETTVMNKIKEIQEEFGIQRIVFVGDRGMITQAQYNKINHDMVKAISALNHKSIEALRQRGIIQLSMFEENNIAEIVDGDIRYCLCKNPRMAVKETAQRQTLLSKTAEELDKIMTCTRKSKYSKEVRSGQVLNKYKMGKFVVFSGSGDNLSYRFDEDKISQEQQLDGCYVTFTDVSPEDMTMVEVVEAYKSLIQVEQAFRSMKTVRLEIRPVYHKKDDRIKCHVFICLLAYYVMWHIKQRLRPFFDSDRAGKKRKFTFDYVIESLKSIRLNSVSFLGANSAVVTTPNDEQKYILDLLELKI